MIELGEYLREKRERRGLSLRQMAGRSGYDNSNLSKIERGELEAAASVLAAYARLLRLEQSEIDYLFSLAGMLPPDIWHRQCRQVSSLVCFRGLSGV